MPVKDYTEYKKREFCNAIKCPVQLKLNMYKEGSDEYEKIRKTCRSDCKFTAWQFHHWLIENGYLILKPKTKN
jgi:hypothetical protein